MYPYQNYIIDWSGYIVRNVPDLLIWYIYINLLFTTPVYITLIYTPYYSHLPNYDIYSIYTKYIFIHYQ